MCLQLSRKGSLITRLINCLAVLTLPGFLRGFDVLLIVRTVKQQRGLDLVFSSHLGLLPLT